MYSVLSPKAGSNQASEDREGAESN
jgi:hypothetical protein